MSDGPAPGSTPPPAIPPDAEAVLTAALDLENDQLLGLLSPFAPARRPVGESASIVDPARVAAHLAAASGRSSPPATAIVRRHWQRRSSLEEAMLELYHGGLSVARAEAAARLLWGDAANIGVVRNCCHALTGRIAHWRARALTQPQVYVYCHAIEVKQRIRHERRVDTLVAAVGVGRKGTREVLAVAGFPDGAGIGWDGVFADLKRRGLHETQLFIGGNDPATSAAVARHFPGAAYQGGIAQLEEEVLLRVSPVQAHFVMSAFASIRAQTVAAAAAAAARALLAKLEAQGSPAAAALVDAALPHLFSYFRFPAEHWARIHDIEPLGRPLREMRERVRLLGPIPDPAALVLLLAARLRCESRRSWARRRFIDFHRTLPPPAPVPRAG